ncbi:MAG: 4,5-DOPA dioxygenase extradiol [Proteobacteria bacterium]|nr:4,5-DOPA dioxygenase extradiol [Pseudomonadota bacterium]
MPALFVGHGSPMNALGSNEWTRAWRALGESLPRPRAILSISAHWYIGGTALTAMPRPRTIHDFGGFPKALHEVQYPAPGDPGLAVDVKRLLDPLEVSLDEDSWGLDHGTWSVLVHLYPRADVPVVQLAIDARREPRFHYDLGSRLRELRARGILVLGSGDVVHNLRTYTWGERSTAAYSWATHFEALVRAHLDAGQHDPLIEYSGLGDEARAAVPTPDHYLPLLYVMGASVPGERVSYPVVGFDGGSVSMLAVQFG